jgi:hypothetical protein
MNAHLRSFKFFVLLSMKYQWNINDMFMLSVSTLCKASRFRLCFWHWLWLVLPPSAPDTMQPRSMWTPEIHKFLRILHNSSTFFQHVPNISWLSWFLMFFRSRHLKITWEFLGATWLNRDSTVSWLETSSSMTEIWAMASRMLLGSQAAAENRSTCHLLYKFIDDHHNNEPLWTFMGK